MNKTALPITPFSSFCSVWIKAVTPLPTAPLPKVTRCMPMGFPVSLARRCF